MSGIRSMLKVNLERRDKLESGMSGALRGYFVERYPTSPMRNVFPTDDDDAIIIEVIGDGIVDYRSR
jgi:hypothetical protein